MTREEWKAKKAAGEIIVPEEPEKAWYYDAQVRSFGDRMWERKAKCKMCYKEVGADGLPMHYNSKKCRYIAENYKNSMEPPTQAQLDGKVPIRAYEVVT